MEVFISGVISGIVASGLFLAISRAWDRAIVPWYEARVYNGIDLGGKWKLSTEYAREVGDDDEWQQAETLSISQRAHHVHGLSVVRPREDDGREERVFKLKGTVVNRFVILSGRVNTRKRIGIQTMLMQVGDDGREILGGCAYYDTDQSQIDVCKLKYIRDPGA